MDSKRWYLSKTIWANALTLLAGILSMFGLDLTPQEQATIVTGIASVLPVVNIILRLVTKTAVK